MNPLAIIEIGARLLDKIIPDKDAREKLQFELIKASQDQDFQLALGQLQVNTEEAKSPSPFVSGWRPYIGWVCGIALTYNFLIYPLMLWFIAVYGSDIKPPPLFSEYLMELVMGMLGLGTLRTFEKWKGVTK
jgi:hypothetical protein